VNDGRIRVATLNAFGVRENWPARRTVMAAGFGGLDPDLVAFQEVIVLPGYDQVRDVLADGYVLAHHGEREADGQGISIASRWPIAAVHEVDLHLGPRPAAFACSALITEIEAPDPVGRLLFVNHLPDWQLDHEAERERQTLAVADVIERLVCDDTFTPENTLTTTAETGDWELEPGRRIDYILVHCSSHGPTLSVTGCRRLFDLPVGGVWASDHFGVTADLSAFTPTGRPLP
jgi:endonuclease/exonuclease/phosphatase family metal-dependent hydrolase